MRCIRSRRRTTSSSPGPSRRRCDSLRSRAPCAWFIRRISKASRWSLPRRGHSERPVLAQGRCDVLVGQVQRSQGGVAYRGYVEFEAAARPRPRRSRPRRRIRAPGPRLRRAQLRVGRAAPTLRGADRERARLQNGAADVRPSHSHVSDAASTNALPSRHISTITPPSATVESEPRTVGSERVARPRTPTHAPRTWAPTADPARTPVRRDEPMMGGRRRAQARWRRAGRPPPLARRQIERRLEGRRREGTRTVGDNGTNRLHRLHARTVVAPL